MISYRCSYQEERQQNEEQSKREQPKKKTLRNPMADIKYSGI